ncbi:MAG: hypothetical protein ACO1N0_20070 [Fluviicola sp.]
MQTQLYSVNQHLIETLLVWVKSGEIAIPEINIQIENKALGKYLSEVQQQCVTNELVYGGITTLSELNQKFDSTLLTT